MGEGQSEDSEGMRSSRKTTLQVSDRVARMKGDGRSNVGGTRSSYEPTDARRQAELSDVFSDAEHVWD